ncbi:MAG TPA: VWA domain-containing protein [Blastocatellia bacterium]|nr:VWA domain-containing protein [Blastocatellia bacterium]
MRNFGRHFIAVVVLLAFVVSLSAQDKPKQEPKEEVLRVDTTLVSIDVAVTSKTGSRSPANLKAEDFVVYEDGVRQKVENFAATEAPFNVALLVDTSGSTKAETDLLKKAARRFLNEMRPQDRIAIIELNQRVSVLEDLTSDRDKLEHAIDFLQPGTGTAFYDALQIALEDVLKKVDGRKAIIALTDGVDSTGGATYDEVLPEIEKSGVTTYILEVNTESVTEKGMMLDCNDEKSFHFSRKQLKKYLREYADGADDAQYEDHCELSRLERMQINRRLYESARKELRELSSQTGGRVYPCKYLSEIEPAYTQIAAELRTLYSLGYYPKNEKRDGKWRTLKVAISRTGLVAKTKPGYRAPQE